MQEAEAIVLAGDGLNVSARLFSGSFVDACKFVWALPTSERADAYVWSDDVTYEPAQLESMRREDEGEI